MKRAVVLLSGGLDSATTAAIARDRGFSLVAVSVDYGQRHRVELEAARRVAHALSVEVHRTVHLDLRAIGGSALTDAIEVPKASPGAGPPPANEGSIPATYVPARNTTLLSVALGLAEVVGAFDLFIGANAVDYSGYPDCRPAFIEAFERLANLATKAAVEGRGTFRVHAPLIRSSKAEIIRTARALGVDLGLTVSCYDPAPDGAACGACDSCRLRKQGFEAAGGPDPTRYASPT
jgi:7-cyano-7-deazaguanine synthase